MVHPVITSLSIVALLYLTFAGGAVRPWLRVLTVAVILLGIYSMTQ